MNVKLSDYLGDEDKVKVAINNYVLIQWKFCSEYGLNAFLHKNYSSAYMDLYVRNYQNDDPYGIDRMVIPKLVKRPLHKPFHRKTLQSYLKN